MAVLREILQAQPATRARCAGWPSRSPPPTPGCPGASPHADLPHARRALRRAGRSWRATSTRSPPCTRTRRPRRVHRSDALLADAAQSARADWATRRSSPRSPSRGAARAVGRRAGRARGPGGGLDAGRAMPRPQRPPPGTTRARRAGQRADRDLLLRRGAQRRVPRPRHRAAVITRHAKALGYDAMVLFLDELILWLSTKITDHTFVNTEGAKLNKLVESADAARPLPIVSFVARQRNLEEFLGPQVGGTEREALAARHAQRAGPARRDRAGRHQPARDHREAAAQAERRDGAQGHRRRVRRRAGQPGGVGHAAARRAVRRRRHRLGRGARSAGSTRSPRRSWPPWSRCPRRCSGSAPR